MSRVAVVARTARVRDALVELARAGCVELDGNLGPPEGEAAEALHRLNGLGTGAAAAPALQPSAPDVRELERRGARALLAGEVELKRQAHLAVDHGQCSAWLGWTPTAEIEDLNERLAQVGAAVVELPRPVWVDPPTLFTPVAVEKPFRPLVQTYGTERYRDVDPTAFTAVSFIVMFAMMFGDVGHGLVLALLALWLRRQSHGRFSAFRHLWLIPFTAGLAAACVGVLYGEAFGPTHLVPTLWLHPLDRPVAVLLVAVAVGAVLLTISYVFGIVNRWRDRGFVEALVAQYGIAGLTAFGGCGILAGGLYRRQAVVEILGGTITAVGLALLTLGLVLDAGRGFAAGAQAAVELVDAVVRMVSNVISFTRLAAFGLMHAALGAVVFDAAQALWGGLLGGILAAVVFVLGNAIAFGLEALVTTVQALRLEYYELYSRIFSGEGHLFTPWRMPVLSTEEES